MNTSDVLNKAADLIEERGWKQGADGWGELAGAPLCLEGGIIAALGIKAEDCLTNQGRREFRACPAYVAVSEHLDDTRSLFVWNDNEHRTASEVVEVLRACAVIEASRERQSAEVSA